MKKFIKNNKIFLLTLLILIIWALYAIISTYMAKVNGRLAYESNDAILIFFSINMQYFWVLQILFPLFVIVPSVWNFNQKMNSGFVKNCLMRQNYKKTMISYYKDALKSVLIFPIFFAFLFILCCILANGIKFGSSIELYERLATTLSDYAGEWQAFTITYFLNIFLYGIFYVNLSLICCRKKANKAISIVLSFITYISLELFINLFCGLFFSRLLNIHNTINLFSLTGVVMYDDVKLCHTIIYAISLVIISSIILYNTYKNEEKVLIEYEK